MAVINTFWLQHLFVMTGTPGGIRTPDTQVRSLMLYPAELRVRAGNGIIDYSLFPLICDAATYTTLP